MPGKKPLKKAKSSKKKTDFALDKIRKVKCGHPKKPMIKTVSQQKDRLVDFLADKTLSFGNRVRMYGSIFHVLKEHNEKTIACFKEESCSPPSVYFIPKSECGNLGHPITLARVLWMAHDMIEIGNDEATAKNYMQICRMWNKEKNDLTHQSDEVWEFLWWIFKDNLAN